MLSTIRKCSKNTDIDVPDHLYVDAIKLIDAYLLRARHPNGSWNQGFVPIDEGVQRSDSTMCFILWRRRFTHNRVAAIDEAIKNGTSPLIDVEELKALELNFNVICNLWLSDVDVNENDFPTTGRKRIVPKFLNRILGLSMAKQSLLMDSFLSFVEVEIKAAKSAGKMDVGIKTLTGQSVDIVDKPRSFRFSEDSQTKVYKVCIDKGLTYEAAQDIFREEIGKESDNAKISTGFYTQQGRGHKTPKVYLIISPDNRSNNCILYRPNQGRKVLTKNYVSHKILWGDMKLITSEDEIKELWEKEYNLSDIPSSNGKSMASNLLIPFPHIPLSTLIYTVLYSI